ncbi:MAG: hypothetical protein ACETWR_14340, partial [Anaerolineae bacterium]
MSGNTFAHTLTRGLGLLVMAALLAGWATSAVQAGPTYQPPTNNVYVIHAGAYVDINTPIGASPLAADDADSDAANCTLRDALGIVNAGTTGGTVNGCTITTVGAPAANIYRINLPTGGYTYTLNGRELLTSANTVYIVGDTAANTIIQASSVDPTQPGPPPGVATYRVLRNSGATVEISNVTIRHGRCAGACALDPVSGGGILNWWGTTTVDGSTVNANQADYGGGIFNAQGTTTVDGSTVSANTARLGGGGIWNWVTLNVVNGSTIGGAGAGNQAGWNGGGICNWGGTTTVDGSTVSANTATNNGGGIWNQVTLSVQNSTIGGAAGAGNQAWDGGGIFSWGGTTTVDGSTVSANAATGGGGGICNWATLNVVNGSTIGGAAGAGNQAVEGGGLCNWGGTTTVDGSTVSANTATSGGGISNHATLNVQNSTIGGAGAGNQAVDGGGIFNRSGTTTVTGSRILYNTATTDGGALYNDRDIAGATSVTNSCIVGNSATSFLNNQPAQQTATGNWWGAWTGPNTPGADTVGGNVDTSGFLTAPILGCPGTARPSGGGGDDDDEEPPPPPPTPIPPPQAREFNCWPWLVVVPPGAAPKAVPGEWCQASLGQPLPAASTFRYLGHSTEVTIRDAAGAAITQFAQPIKVCFHYTQPELDAVGGDPADFLLQVWRDGKWDALDTRPDGSLRYRGVCAPVDHLTLFALFARDGAALDASAAAASDSELVFPTHLPETGAPPGGWPLVVVGLWLVLAGYAARRS